VANYRLRIGQLTGYTLPANSGVYLLTGVAANLTLTGAVGIGLAPSSPVFLRTTGSLVGQIPLSFLKPDYLANGTAITAQPVTQTRLYLFASETEARKGSSGSYSATVAAGTASTATFSSVSAGTYWVCAECDNGAAVSYPSHPIQVTVT
jgi:hypothetical protein